MNGSRLVIRLLIIGAIALSIYGFLQIPAMIQRLRPQKSINILMWPNVMDAQYLADFEKKTVIKWYLFYCEISDELLVKIISSAGDYDLIIAADYVFNLLLE